MSEGNVELTHRVIEAFNRRDLAGYLELVDPNVEFTPVRGLGPGRQPLPRSYRCQDLVGGLVRRAPGPQGGNLRGTRLRREDAPPQSPSRAGRGKRCTRREAVVAGHHLAWWEGRLVVRIWQRGRSPRSRRP